MELDFFKNNNNFEKIQNVKSECLFGDETLLSQVDITICIPTYKREKTLKEAIDSALQQKYASLSYCVIVVDNNTDKDNNTLKLIQTYTDKRILYFKNEKNLGMFNNWNRCFEIAKSRWVALLHDYDFLKTYYIDYVNSLLPIIKKRNLSCLCFAFDRLYKDGRKNTLVKKEAKRIKSICKRLYSYFIHIFRRKGLTRITTPLVFLFGGNSFAIPSCGILFDREKLLKSGGFNEDFYPISDFVLLLYFMHKREVYFSHHSVGIYRWELNESLKTETRNKSLEGSKAYTIFLGKKHKILNTFFKDELMREKSSQLERKEFVPSRLLFVIRKLYDDIFLYSDAVRIYE